MVSKKEMSAVYGPYCRNHDDVIALLEKVGIVLVEWEHIVIDVAITHSRN